MDAANYIFTRFVFQRALGVIYFFGFLIAVNQFKALCGRDGLTPVRLFLPNIRFFDSPSLFWFFYEDWFLMSLAWLGLGLSIIALTGVSEFFGNWFSAGIWFLLWMIYLSFVNAGQVFYGFGWETLLLETGFLAIFLGSLHSSPPQIVLWLLRWILFRVMFGAGLIKIRGDSCWRDLTCLNYHYETQPLPGPLSWYFHHLPEWFQKASVAFNHFTELFVPFGLLLPWGWARISAGVITIIFQATLLASGNLSWLNCITIVLCLSCFDDRVYLAILGKLPQWEITTAAPQPLFYTLAAIIGVLSIQPVVNLFSNTQVMNTSFEPFRLVNTYGAFGSVTRERKELIIEGTDDSYPTAQSKWREYEFKGKPGDLSRRPPQVTPYHYKIDWQMWFAAMNSYQYNPWLVNLVAHLLKQDPAALALLKTNPFPDQPPQFIRIVRYIYHFTEAGEANWWSREFRDIYLPPLSLKDPQFIEVLKAQGWLD